MANGYFERGEIYWVRMDSGFGYEQGVGRPAVILSCDRQNNSSGAVTVAFCSKQPSGSWEVEIEATGCTSYIKCSQISTVDKTRLGKCTGILNKAEMAELDRTLEKLLDLGYIDDTAVKEKETEIAALKIQIKELKEEMAKLQGEIAARAADDMAVKVENAMWQRLYEKALDQVCSMKLTGDIERRTEKSALVDLPQFIPKNREEPATEDEPKLVDINTAKFDEFRRIGLSSGITLNIINKRPFSSVEDLKKIPGITSTMYGIVSKKVCCSVVPKEQPKKPAVEPEAEKVNVNTATAKELMEALGLGTTSAYSVTGYRKKNGPFKSVEELANVQNWSEKMVAKYRDKLEV